MEKEIKYYISKLNPYGVPLDNRADFTKLDWMYWVAAMGTKEQFTTLTVPIFKFANETPDRVPLTDWYQTSVPRQQGFRARPVVGGLFARMLLA
jgi:hypothetical protein